MIIVKNRELLIPNNERYIGTTYDNETENRVFQVPRFSQRGVDLAALTFRLDIQYANEAFDTVLLDKEVGEAFIILIWRITSSTLQVPGTLYIGLRAIDDEATVKWSSFSAAMYAERHLNTPGNYGGSLTEIEQIEQDHQYMKGVVDELKANIDYAHDAEAWAKGTRSGSAVPSTDSTYHNNSKYHSEQASAKATQAANSATAAANSATQAAETVADTNTRFNNAMEAVTSETEVIDARVGADGTTYPVLKTRLDTEHTNLKNAIDAAMPSVLSLYNATELSRRTYTNNYAVAVSGRVHTHSGAVVNKFAVTAGQIYYMSLSRDYTDEAVYQFMDTTTNPIYNDNGRIGDPCLHAVEGFVKVPEGAAYIFVTTNQENTTSKIYQLDSEKLDELDLKADKTTVEDLSYLVNTVNGEIFELGEEKTPGSTLAGYAVIATDGHVGSNANYTLYKYRISSQLIYIDAEYLSTGNNCTVSFRSDDASTSTGVIKMIPGGMNQIYAVPEGATHLYISVPTDMAISVKDAAYASPDAVLHDGDVTYAKLDAYLQSKVDQIGAITTETGVGAFHAETDAASLGAELLDGTGWTGTGWTGDFANGFTPSVGADPLVREISGLVPGGLYRFTITTSNAHTNGYSDFNVSLGGSATFQTYKGGGASVSYEFGLVAGSDNANLTITPINSYTGTITGMSLKAVSNLQTPAVVISDTDDMPTAQILTGKDDLASIYVGLQSGAKAFFAKANTAFGVNALKAVTDGFWNSAFGMNALADCIHGSRNIAIGYIALQHCVTGDRNIAVGTFALNGLTNGRGNIAIGADAMQTANGNYGIGIGVGANGGSGDENIAIGRRAGNASGAKNAIVGSFAMESASSGGFNVAVGYQAGQKSTGNYNVNVGAMAGKNSTSGSNNILIGYNAQKPAATDSNTIVIGGSDHNQVIIAGKVINFNQDGTVTWSELT